MAVFLSASRHSWMGSPIGYLPKTRQSAIRCEAYHAVRGSGSTNLAASPRTNFALPLESRLFRPGHSIVHEDVFLHSIAEYVRVVDPIIGHQECQVARSITRAKPHFGGGGGI
jgi:hypothetical protein